MFISRVMTDPDQPRCWNCAACADLGRHLECRASPPAVTAVGAARWPQVEKFDWCRGWEDFRAAPAQTGFSAAEAAEARRDMSEAGPMPAPAIAKAPGPMPIPAAPKVLPPPPPPPPPPPVAAPRAEAVPAQPREAVRRVDRDQVEHWAISRGIVFDGGNIAEVNDKRRALGLAPFEINGRTR